MKVIDLDGKEIGEKKLPKQFCEVVRPDLIKRAVLVIQNNKRQPYGAKPFAGMRASAKLSRRRNNYRGAYGTGISRVPRKIMSRRGTRMNWVGAVAPGTTGGRRAHPPKSEKIWSQKINKKERRKAIRSAISATVTADIVKERGHSVPDNYPFVVDNKIESLEKTKDVLDALKKIGLEKELERTKNKKIRAGRGKMRGRKYRKGIGPLIIVSRDCKITKSAANIAGVDVCEVKKINAELLAPGTIPGRLSLWTKSAIEFIEKEKLFI